MPRSEKVRIHAVVLSQLRKLKDARRRNVPAKPWLAQGPPISAMVSWAVVRYLLDHPDPEVREHGQELEHELGDSMRLLRRESDIHW